MHALDDGVRCNDNIVARWLQDRGIVAKIERAGIGRQRLEISRDQRVFTGYRLFALRHPVILRCELLRASKDARPRGRRNDTPSPFEASASLRHLRMTATASIIVSRLPTRKLVAAEPAGDLIQHRVDHARLFAIDKSMRDI